MRLWKILKTVVYRQEATTAVEYAVMLAMILLFALGAIQMVGGQAGGMWGGIIDDLRAVGFIK